MVDYARVSQAKPTLGRAITKAFLALLLGAAIGLGLLLGAVFVIHRFVMT